jgi:hypothetical protein
VNKIIVLCEGDTEELAIRHFVARQWEKDGLSLVGLHHRWLPPRKIGPFARNYLDNPDVLAVFTLVDLYGMNLISHRPNDDLDTKVKRVQAWFRDQVEQHSRARDFHPHLSVHEVEAWILAEGDALSRRLKDPRIRQDPNAESKNFQRPPKKLLNELFWRNRKTRYEEITDGQPLFSKMSFQPVYNSCPYFRKFYDDLLRAAGRP